MKIKKVVAVFLAITMLILAQSTSVLAAPTGNTEEKLKIAFIDCGRKYFSPKSIKDYIDNAAINNFNAVQLAFGNDGLRLLLDDMSVGQYSSEQVKDAIHRGNIYYNENQCVGCPYVPDKNEYTQAEMDGIIAYAKIVGIEIIPVFNTPGHSNTVVNAMGYLGIKNANAPNSKNTINMFKNPDALNFTKELVQKYINYFSSRGCKYFNFGADEYANDAGASGGFAVLNRELKWGEFVAYINDIASRIKKSGMKPMAFNDAFYYTTAPASKGFDTDIIICYWSKGWVGHFYASAKTIAKKGHKLINTNQGFYWVLGNTNWQCNEQLASTFEFNKFEGSTVENPAGAMFCIWCDTPGAESDEAVIQKTEMVLKSFGGKLPKSPNKMNIGDINTDSLINETDYQQLANLAINSEPLRAKDGDNGYINTFKADIVQDGVIDILDITLMEKLLKGYTIDLSIGSRGDVDRNGVIDQADKTMITDAIQNNKVSTLKSFERYACDLNSDGVVDDKDLSLVDTLV